MIGNLIGHRDTVCYGVEIPGVEGRAGMVAFVGKAIVKEHDLTSALFYVFFIVSIYDVKNDCLIGTELIEQKVPLFSWVSGLFKYLITNKVSILTT